MKKTQLGKIVDSFTVPLSTGRALVVVFSDDSGKEWKLGDILEIELTTGNKVEAKIIDAVPGNSGQSAFAVEQGKFKPEEVVGCSAILIQN